MIKFPMQNTIANYIASAYRTLLYTLLDTLLLSYILNNIPRRYLSSQFVHVCILEEDFRHGWRKRHERESEREWGRGERERDRIYATGRQSNGSSCYTHISQSADRHLARIVAMIFQPPLIYLVHFLSFWSHFFPQGVAFNRPGCSPTFFLPAFR